MKNIYEILADYGLTLEEDKREDFEKQLFSNYKTVAEMEKKDAKLTQLEELLTQKEQEFSQALAQRDFSAMLHTVITEARGRNPKAILALLDQEALKNAQNPGLEAQKAVENLKKTDGYLFETKPIPPLYARGTGTETGAKKSAPATLAGALQERFNQERK